jgi:hypothetical protein
VAEAGGWDWVWTGLWDAVGVAEAAGDSLDAGYEP